MNCPRCGQVLVKSFYKGKIEFLCPDGHGHSVTLPAVRALCGNAMFANVLWRKALEASQGNGGACPQCGRPMSLIRFGKDEHEVEVDICCRCQQLWFDPQELEALPLPSPPQSKEAELPAKARELLAMHAIEIEHENERQSKPDNVWCWVAGFMGFPVEKNAPPRSNMPWCTFSIAAVCTLVFLASWSNLESVVEEWGMIPADCLRHYGLTFISSMFLHGGFWHLLGNMYFLLIFGDNVEDVLGIPKYLALALASGLSASLLYIAFAPKPYIPCVGASGFISGIIAAYAVFFPKVSISFLFRIGLFFRWISIPAWGAFGIWLLYQGIMSICFAGGGSSVAYCAHLGGAIFGICAGLLMRQQVKKCLEML